MRYRLLSKVDCNLYIRQLTVIERDNIRFEFLPDDKGRTDEVAVSIKIPKEKLKEFKSSIYPGRGDEKIVININTDKELHDLLIFELQALESHLAFASSGALEKIDWNSSIVDFIPENNEEKKLIAATHLSHKSSYSKKPFKISSQALEEIVSTPPEFGRLIIPEAFWREGMNYFQKFQYIQSFYQFYFIIEDFYAKGKTGEKQVLKAFQESKDFKEICEHSLQQILNKPKHSQRIEKLFKEEKIEMNGKGLQKLLFKIRGNLHHFFCKSPKTRGTPFNQKEFETEALLTMHISMTAILYSMVDINRETALKND